MHPSMFNDLPTPRQLFGCLGAVLASAAAAGLLVGWLIWGGR